MRATRRLLDVVAVVIAVATIFPIYWMVLAAVKPPGEIQSLQQRPWTLAPSLDAFRRVIAVDDFGRYFLNSLLVALVVVAVSAQYFVQSAYASGPVDLIVAGLTILDPLVAVSLGVLVLGEAAATPLWAVGAYAVSGAAAVMGVVLLARHHPQAHLRTAELTAGLSGARGPRSR